jgi:hypothetical protein
MDWRFDMCHNNSDFRVGVFHGTLGDAYSAAIPTDKLCTLNWVTKGRIKLYAADMTFIAEYGPGERMMVSDSAHLAMGKAVLVAASDEMDYYCMRSNTIEYLDGEIVTLAANETRTFSDITGKSIFVSDGELTAPKVYTKHALLVFESANEITVTAGPEGAMLVLFWKLS